MKFQELKKTVCRLNQELVLHRLVFLTWGNASVFDREQNLIAIKPSGVPYDTMSPDDMVVLDMDGKILDGHWKPSSDSPTHLALYRAFPEIRSVVHTHSTYATAWAQSQRDIPIIGTTHADYFAGAVPCTRSMTETEIHGDYEAETGKVIIECFRSRKINPLDIPAVLVSNHGPLTWGKKIDDAVEHAVILEEIAKMAYLTSRLNPDLPTNPVLNEKHFLRKNGKDAYYGQNAAQ